MFIPLTNKKTVNIYFHSEGGDAYAAMALGQLIWENGWRTFVAPKGKCISACSLAWSAGNDGGPLKTPYRVRPPDSELGIHGISIHIEKSEFCQGSAADNLVGDSARAAAQLTRYLVKMKFTDDFIDEIMDTSQVVSDKKEKILTIGGVKEIENQIKRLSFNDEWINDFWNQISNSGAQYLPYK